MKRRTNRHFQLPIREIYTLFEYMLILENPVCHICRRIMSHVDLCMGTVESGALYLRLKVSLVREAAPSGLVGVHTEGEEEHDEEQPGDGDADDCGHGDWVLTFVRT